MANEKKSAYDRKTITIIMAVVATMAMFCYPPLAMEHYILASLAVVAIVTATTIYTRKDVEWWWVERTPLVYIIIMIVWWALVGFAEFAPTAWYWVRYSALYLYQMLLSNDHTRRDIIVVLGTLGALPVVKTTYHIATAHYRDEISRLKNELSESKLKAEASEKAREERRWKLGCELADAVVALKSDKRSGDQTIGKVRVKLEEVLNNMFYGGICMSALMYQAAERFESRKRQIEVVRHAP